MQLFYYKAPKGNVGDDLNAELWPTVFGQGFFDSSSEVRFIGIGSVLDQRHPAPPAGRRHVVFGAGIRSVRTAPIDYSYFDLRFVRGPLSKAVVNQDVDYISDPAIIAPRVMPVLGTQVLKGRIGFVPYYLTSKTLQDTLAKDFDLRVISTSLPPHEFISELMTCELVVCEAMHGAILADAYRIPWVAVRLTSGIFEGRTSLFKWRDWMESLSINSTILDALPSAALYPPRGVRRLLNQYAVATASKVMERALTTRALVVMSDDKALYAAQDRILSEAEILNQEIVRSQTY